MTDCDYCGEEIETVVEYPAGDQMFCSGRCAHLSATGNVGEPEGFENE